MGGQFKVVSGSGGGRQIMETFTLESQSKESKRRMPAQKPGKSEQVVCTPPDFLKALKNKLGIKEFSWDLAADESNAVAAKFYTEEDDALIQPWTVGGWAYCNPPYADIEPWVAKAGIESQMGANVAMLLPASTGSNWWKHYVHEKCLVLLLNGRIKFIGHTNYYPKDLVTLIYSPYARGYNVWTWRENL